MLRRIMKRTQTNQNEQPLTAAGVLRRRLLLSAVPLLLVAAQGCSSGEQLGRSELLFVSSHHMAVLAKPAWAVVMEQTPVSEDAAHTKQVRRVANKIIKASRNDPDDWAVAIFESDEIHAFALPNRKIGVFTGILDRIENDDQLAAVMAHALAHVNYNHFGERFSQSSLAQNGLSINTAIASSKKYEKEIAALFGVAADRVGLSPFAREHELAADKFCVRYMARAGYAPVEADRLWRSLADTEAADPSMLLAMHPVDQTRLAHLEQEIDLLGASVS